MKTVYVLVDPRPPMETVYVGSARDPVQRLRHHVSRSSIFHEKSVKSDWINGLVKQHLVPLLCIIETVSENEIEERELFWISYYVEMGLHVVNTKGMPRT